MEVENRDDGRSERENALKTRNLAAQAEGAEAEEMIPEIRQKISDTKKDMPKRSKAGVIFFLILAVFIVLAVIRVVQLQMEENRQTAEAAVLTNVQVQQVQTGDIAQYSPVSGRIVSSEDAVNVIPMVSGEVTEVFVEEGDYVTAGQTLFTIDSDQAQTQIRSGTAPGGSGTDTGTAGADTGAAGTDTGAAGSAGDSVSPGQRGYDEENSRQDAVAVRCGSHLAVGSGIGAGAV